MHCVNLAEAKAGLSGLLDAVEAGEVVVVITRRGRSVARLIRDSDGEAAFSDWVARLRRFHAHQPGPWDPQWSCCGSCAIRSLESGKDLPHALPNLVRPAGAISTGESPRPAPSRHQQRYGESTPHPSDSNGLTPGPSPTGHQAETAESLRRQDPTLQGWHSSVRDRRSAADQKVRRTEAGRPCPRPMV